MKKSFTLLEMLVVIGIIAILVTIGFASYSTVQKKARNAKRASDLKNFQSAIEQCYSVNSFIYPIISQSPTGTIAYTCPAATGGPSMTITDPLGTTYTITTSSTTAYNISVSFEPSGSFPIQNQQ